MSNVNSPSGGDRAEPDLGQEETVFSAPPPGTGSGPASDLPDAPTVVAQIPAATNRLQVGTIINNNYRIDAILKSGGMGEVFRGTELHTDNPVAIKAILQDQAENAEAMQMFRREAGTLSKLADETIVRYLNFVPDPGLNRYFLVMEFIPGIQLKDHLAAQGALPVDKVLLLLDRLAKGLAAAHERQVIHRDLSPDNVMLQDGKVEQARLIDFGIAKSTVMTEATVADRFAGKLRYAAPEQLGIHGGTITPATDIYSLGLVMAAAAAGRPLEMGGSILEAVQSRQQIPDLSTVPESLRPLLSYMLEPDPARRPASMSALRQMIATPALIPQRYLGRGTVPAAALGQSRGAPRSSSLQLPGQGPVSLPPGPGAAPPLPGPAGGSGSVLPTVLALVLLAGVGTAGVLAWQQGLLTDLLPAQTAPADAALPPGASEESPSRSLPPVLSDTRDGFLATLETGPCTYVSRIAQGVNTGVIEGFSTTETSFAGVPVAYEEKFGARPEVLSRLVTPDQCAALDLARAVQGRGRSGINLLLSSDQAASAAPVTAQMTVPETQSVWLGLISPRGIVYNLSERVSGAVGNIRTRGFALTLGAGIEAAPQLLLAIESDTPLTSTALGGDRVEAAALFPQVLAEIRDRGGAASVSLAYLNLLPAVPATSDEPPATGD